MLLHAALCPRQILKNKLRVLAAAVAGNRGLRRRMIGLLVVYAIGTCVLTALVWEMHSEAISAGEKVLTAFTQLTEEQTTRTIQNVDQTLEIAEEKLASLRSAPDAQSVRRELKGLLENRPYLKAIIVLDRTGSIVFRSGSTDAALNLSDRPFFIAQRDHPSGFQLGAPIQARTTADWILPASRALKDANGAFDGVIVGGVDPYFFVRVWNVGKDIAGQATTLWLNDGRILIRSPFDERAMGPAVNKGELASLIRRGSEKGTLRAISAIDGKDRLIVYRRLATYPAFSLSVTQSTEQLLATWWRTAWLVAIGWAFSGAALAWLAVKLMREVVNTHASDDRYRVLFKESPYAMLVADKKTLRFLAVNEAAVRQYGWSLAEHLEMTIDDHYPPEELPALRERRRKRGFELSRTLTGIRHRRKDGSVMDMEMAVRQIDFEGRPAYLALAQDVGARLSLERQLLQAQKMEVVGQLTGGIAHDFNNILMVILGNVDVLLDENLGPVATERLESVGEAVDRASTLTRQLLAFSRQQPLRPQPTDLNALIADTGKLLRRTLGPQIEVDSMLAEDLCIVQVDRAQLETALVNLCLNARDAMPDGGALLIESRNVVIDADYVGLNPEAVVGAYAMIEVSDGGTGIAPEDLNKVFEPFFTTKGVGKGSGLGLSMVYGFIRQSKGFIKIYSELGQGTSIRLYLPCTGADADRLLIEKGGAAARGTERILVVEDEPRVRASVVRQLCSLGYVVVEAADGEAGLAMMETTLPRCDLLLTDIMMPGRLNGKSLADVVERRWPKTRVVFMSGFSEASIIHQGRLDEGVLLLNKPFRKADLARIIRQALDAPVGEVAA
jgi:PAS domain S-box-containing protein